MHTQNLTKNPVPGQDGWVTLSGPCTATGKEYESPPVPLASVEAYEKGALAQSAFPMLTDEQREFLISGTSPTGWRELFPPEPGDISARFPDGFVVYDTGRRAWVESIDTYDGETEWTTDRRSARIFSAPTWAGVWERPGIELQVPGGGC